MHSDKILPFILLLTGISLPAFAQHPHAAEHGGQIFHAFRSETGIGGEDHGGGFFDWDFDGWIGTDENKLWLKSEGERRNGTTHQAEFWAIYGHNITTFWDAQVGIRHDTRPGSLGYLILGFEGLAPYYFETEAHLFISEDGDVSVRLRKENDLLLTQKLILQPHIEADLYAQDVPELELGAGLSRAEIGLQMRYEFTRQFAPYIELRYEHAFGESSAIARRNGESRGTGFGTAGLRLLF